MGRRLAGRMEVSGEVRDCGGRADRSRFRGAWLAGGSSYTAADGSSFQMSITHFQMPPGSLRETVTPFPCAMTDLPSGSLNVIRFVPVA